MTLAENIAVVILYIGIYLILYVIFTVYRK